MAIVRPPTGTHARGRVRSGTVSAHVSSRHSLSSSPGSLPPVPPVPVPNLTARRGGLPAPAVTKRNSADRPVSSRIASPTHRSPIDDEGAVGQSTTLMSTNSSQRRDHARHKQSHRPRDSLVLEKARLFDHLRALCKLVSSWRNCHSDFIAQHKMKTHLSRRVPLAALRTSRRLRSCNCQMVTFTHRIIRAFLPDT